MKFLLPAAAAVVCSGCFAHWPPETGGGGAEHSAYEVRGRAPKQRAENAALAERLRDLTATLNAMERDVAFAKRNTAALVLAQRRALRARREIDGLLHGAAALDLVALQHDVDVLSARHQASLATAMNVTATELTLE